jgi:S1-C subfamily serine protease
MKYLKLLLLMLLSTTSLAESSRVSMPVDHMEASASSVEKRVRAAAVRVTVPFSGGHGSGSYIKYKDAYLVITAQHVVSGALGTKYLTSHKEESHIGVLIYSDPENDIGILYIANPFRQIEPMKYNPVESVADVGTEIFYSGYPSHHKLMSFAGRVAGYEPNGTSRPGKHIILQTYGWFGCSGSVIYNTKGQQIGVLYGVDVEYYPNIQVQENMIWVAPMNLVDMRKALNPLCRGFRSIGKKLKACR